MWTKGAALGDARTRKGNVRIHAVVWIGSKINIARLDREFTIVTTYYYTAGQLNSAVMYFISLSQ